MLIKYSKGCMQNVCNNKTHVVDTPFLQCFLNISMVRFRFAAVFRSAENIEKSTFSVFFYRFFLEHL